MWNSIQQMVRIVMQIVAGFLAGQGIITESMTETVIGAGVSLAAIAWWIVWERHREGAEPPKLG